MVNMMDQDTRTERKQVFDTQPSRRNRLFFITFFLEVIDREISTMWNISFSNHYLQKGLNPFYMS